VFRKPFEGAFPQHHFVPTPAQAGGLEAATAALDETLDAHGHEIAAMIVEPVVQGASGMQMYAPAYLRVVRDRCDRHGVLFVADEVFTGYGRTGPMWACELAGVSPDVLCTAKGFSGGTLPMAATLFRESFVQRGFGGARDRAFYYGHSFCGNPLGCAVALEVLDVYEQERILERAKPKAERIATAFAEMESLGGVSRTRSLGMIGALELGGDAGYLAEAGWRVYDEARRRGAYLRPMGNCVYVAPPLNVPDAVLDDLLGIVRDAIVAIG
jgi:adenosylmethionine-8-amino-7-oxononanoate aminotransferase